MATDPSLAKVDRAIALDNYRISQVKQLQKRKILDQAYAMVENRQKNLDEMMKHIHVVNNKPKFISPVSDQARPMGNQVGRSTSLPRLPSYNAGGYPMAGGSFEAQGPYGQVPYGQVPYGQQLPYGFQPQQPFPMGPPPMRHPYPGPDLAPYQLNPSQPNYSYGDYQQQSMNPHGPPSMTPEEQQKAKEQENQREFIEKLKTNPEEALKYLSSQHPREDVRRVLDQATKSLQSKNLAAIEARRKKLLTEIEAIKSQEIDKVEKQQKMLYEKVSDNLQQNQAKEEQIERSLMQQQNILFQMLQISQSSQQVAMTQHEKNEKLLSQIDKFERKNKELRAKINKAVLIHLGDKVVDQAMPDETDENMKDILEVKHQMRDLVEGNRRVGRQPGQDTGGITLLDGAGGDRKAGGFGGAGFDGV